MIAFYSNISQTFSSQHSCNRELAMRYFTCIFFNTKSLKSGMRFPWTAYMSQDLPQCQLSFTLNACCIRQHPISIVNDPWMHIKMCNVHFLTEKNSARSIVKKILCMSIAQFILAILIVFALYESLRDWCTYFYDHCISFMELPLKFLNYGKIHPT